MTSGEVYGIDRQLTVQLTGHSRTTKHNVIRKTNIKLRLLIKFDMVKNKPL